MHQQTKSPSSKQADSSVMHASTKRTERYNAGGLALFTTQSGRLGIQSTSLSPSLDNHSSTCQKLPPTPLPAPAAYHRLVSCTSIVYMYPHTLSTSYIQKRTNAERWLLCYVVLLSPSLASCACEVSAISRVPASTLPRASCSSCKACFGKIHGTENQQNLWTSQRTPHNKTKTMLAKPDVPKEEVQSKLVQQEQKSNNRQVINTDDFDPILKWDQRPWQICTVALENLLGLVRLALGL